MRTDDDQPAPQPWWSIHGGELLAMLHRAHNGEDPDMIYAEAYVNSDHEHPGGNDG